VRILSRYFVSGYLVFYAGIVVVSMLVIAVIEMMVNLDHILEYGDGLAGAASYLFLKLPSYYLGYVVPAGSFGAAFLCLGMPARSLEVLAAKASGISPPRLARPVLVTAALVSALALLVNETIVRDTANRFNLAETGGVGELFQGDGEFWESRGGTLLSVEEVDRDERTLRGVRVYERDLRGHLVRSVHAEVAILEPDRRWRLHGAVFRDFSPADPVAPPRTERREIAWLDLGILNDLSLLGADPRALSLWRLSVYVDALAREGRDDTRYRALWHSRLSEPLSVFLFALIGAPLGMAVERSRSLAVAALQGVGLLGAYYGLRAAATLFASGGVGGSVAPPWLLLGAFGAFGAWRLARAGR
jgi:LPS export ABC transporter permease LptG